MSSKEVMILEMSKSQTKLSKTKIVLLSLLVFIVIAAGACIGFVTASLNAMPTLKGDIRPAASSQIFDNNGTLIATIHSTENRIPVPLKKIPKNLQNAFIAVEDNRFYQHSGIDPKSIARAVWNNLTDRNISEGGSTITQQLAKNALLTQEQTLKRKVQEAFLALQIERQYSKSEILELYLNQIYFGQGAYGVQEAAQVYFGKNVEDLNLAECSMLAGIPKSPNYYSPLGNAKAAKERQAIVLEQMMKYGYIDSSTVENVKKTKLNYAKPNESTVAPYFVEYVTQQIIDKYGANALYKQGLKIYTSIDLSMQSAAESAMKQLPVLRTDSNGIQQPQGALIAIDPHNGYIKAMVGGRGNDQFNRAVMAERQPGSAFKAFVYLAAIEGGAGPSSMVDDTPFHVGGYAPSNDAGEGFHGRVTLRTALEYSYNIPAVKLAQQFGVEKVLYLAQQMGISTLVMEGNKNDRNLATALGGLTRGVTPMDMASAYGVLANQGVRAEPVAILKVVDRDGKVLEQYTVHAKSIVSDRSAYTLTDMLRGVITHGTATAANIGRPAAGKTGTTDENKDAWFVGYTPDLVAAVWMGVDSDGRLSSNTYGGTIPAAIWHSFMIKALENIPAKDFIKPTGAAPPNASSKDGMLIGEPGDKNSPAQQPTGDGAQKTPVTPPPSPPASVDDKEEDKNRNHDKDTEREKYKPAGQSSDSQYEKLPPPPPKEKSSPSKQSTDGNKK